MEEELVGYSKPASESSKDAGLAQPIVSWIRRAIKLREIEASISW